MNDHETQPLAVRVIYIIPTDAEPWVEAKQRATECLEDIQCFFADEMARWGYGLKTFKIATDETGSLVFHQIKSGLTKKDFENGYWNNCKNTAQEYGLRNLNYATVYFYEAYSITNGMVNAGSKGWPRGKGGEAFLSSFHLKVTIRDWIADTSGYGGRVFDWIDSEPLAENLRVGKNERGPALGDLSGAGYGIIAHELAHCFNPPKQEKGKRGRTGPLMGLGQLGMRGYFRPDLTDDRCILREEDAAALDKSDFFDFRKLKPKSIIFTGNKGSNL